MTFSDTETLTEIETDNLSLKFEDGIAHLSVTGSIQDDTMQTAKDWFSAAKESVDEYNICVDLAKMDFPDLGTIDKQFVRLANLWRYAGNAEKCAVLTDSKFVQSKARVESAVIPGLEIESFDLEDMGQAMDWLGATPPAQGVATKSAPAEPVKDENVDLASMFGQ